MVSGHEVDLVDQDKMDEFIVTFKGPADSPYEGVSKKNSPQINLGLMES